MFIANSFLNFKWMKGFQSGLFYKNHSLLFEQKMEYITCSSLIIKYYWDELCLHWKSKSVCYEPHCIYLSFPGAFSSSCPPNWIIHKNNCYLFSTSLASWNRSKRQCSQLHSNLLKIDSAEELVSVDSSYNYLWSILSRNIEVDSR